MIFNINEEDYAGSTWDTLKDQVFKKHLSNQLKADFLEKWPEARFPDQALGILREGILWPVYWWFHHYVWVKTWFYPALADYCVKVHAYLDFLDALESDDLDYLWGFSWATGLTLTSHEKMYLLS